jgi:hypothetical protein
MSTTLENLSPVATATAARRLRTTMAAVRLSFTWFGTRKSLSPQQKEEAADSFGAEGAYLSAAKKLFDTRHPAFKAVSAVRGRAISLWKGLSLPFPESGIRLIRQDDVSVFDVRMNSLRAELGDAVKELDEHFVELKGAARARLGRLFNATDYPHSLVGLFQVEHDFPSVDAPEYLRELSPELFHQEQARVAARFEEAVRLAEEAFTAEFAKVVGHLTERLGGTEDGKPKVFRDSVIENVSEFFERFRVLNVRSNDQLDELVEQAQRIVRGLEPQQLRDNGQLRQQVVTQLSGVQSVLDGLMVDRPRRRIIRSGAGEVR